MLKNIHPLLNADLLYALDNMGHGDSLAIVDANFPAASKASHQLICQPGNTASEVLEAVLTVFPLDPFDEYPIKVMQQIDSDMLSQAAVDFLSVIEQSDETGHLYQPVERFDFYDLVEKCQLVIRTSDLRPYGCLVLTKGVIFNE